VLDPVLASLGGRPWLERRPELAVFLLVKNRDTSYIVAAGDDDRQPMRQSFEAAADLLAMKIIFPPSSQAAALNIDFPAVGQAELDDLAKRAGVDRALAGSLTWRDPDLGWVADWQLSAGGRTWKWQVRGVGFDEAFRVAMRGAAQILSGNGQP
jgi:hypothetical protein